MANILYIYQIDINLCTTNLFIHLFRKTFQIVIIPYLFIFKIFKRGDGVKKGEAIIGQIFDTLITLIEK